jgi:uncharacterized protein
MPSLSDKLKSLGVKVGAQDLPLPPLPQPSQGQSSLEQILGGHPLANSHGETYVVETHYPLEHRHGQVGLLKNDTMRVLAAWAGDPRLADFPLHEFAFLDIETTGLSGGTGTYAFLIGAARFKAQEYLLEQFFMRDPLEEPAQLIALEEFLAPCRALVTFNGKSFDAPLINTRYLVHGWRSPLLDLGHIDLLHLARRLWRGRLPSRTLGNLEVQILGSERTEEDIPGWAIPQIYFDYVHTLDPAPLKSVFYHNAMDVVSLTALFNYMAGLLENPFEAPIQHGVDLIAIARLYEDIGEIDKAVQLYLNGLAYEDLSNSSVNPEYRLSKETLLDAIDRLALIYKRRTAYPEAISLWEKAAQYNHVQAYVELAKYFEHQQRNYPAAFEWTSKAYELVNNGIPHYERLQWLPELEARLSRLQTKLSTAKKS